MILYTEHLFHIIVHNFLLNYFHELEHKSLYMPIIIILQLTFKFFIKKIEFICELLKLTTFKITICFIPASKKLLSNLNQLNNRLAANGSNFKSGICNTTLTLALHECIRAHRVRSASGVSTGRWQ